jgi:hypothetical protein
MHCSQFWLVGEAIFFFFRLAKLQPLKKVLATYFQVQDGHNLKGQLTSHPTQTPGIHRTC